jgi:hypothetical protein
MLTARSAKAGLRLLPTAKMVGLTLFRAVLQSTLVELKKEFYRKKKQYYPARQRYTLPPKEGQKSGTALKDGDKLGEAGLTNGSVLYFKDLGPQVIARQRAGGGLGTLHSCSSPWRSQQQQHQAAPSSSTPTAGCGLLAANQNLSVQHQVLDTYEGQQQQARALAPHPHPPAGITPPPAAAPSQSCVQRASHRVAARCRQAILQALATWLDCP